MENETKSIRSISTIAYEIVKKWPKPYFGAVPYIDAMKQLNLITDTYIAESGRSIVSYFLSNASSWKGDDAKRIKAELKQLMNGAR